VKKLSTLALIATSLASPLTAFELDISRKEIAERFEVFTVSDLALGQTGLVRAYYACYLGGQLHLYNAVLESDRRFSNFEVELQPSGRYRLTFFINDWDEKPQTQINFNNVVFESCEEQMIDFMDGAFPVESIDGFTRYSDWLENILATYEIER
jgi:hypothetical protein